MSRPVRVQGRSSAVPKRPSNRIIFEKGQQIALAGAMTLLTKTFQF